MNGNLAGIGLLLTIERKIAMSEEKPLRKEYEYYLKIKPELLAKSKGKFALIKGEELIGTFDTDGDAYKFGLSKFGNTPFLIIKVSEQDESTHIPILELGLLDAGL